MIQFKHFETFPMVERMAAGLQLAPAEVIVVRDNAVVVSFGVQQAEVRSAILDYDPSPGDRGDDTAEAWTRLVVPPASPETRPARADHGSRPGFGRHSVAWPVRPRVKSDWR